ncbi:transposase [Cucumis melo var. makuwa]|uniref:Transposase n=1 Tax=Cucumis melo var. makuwa TaxID=1194695 RepID=A0A5A7VQ72_CUCMM|nr:transposase [Cucumis melo var. makuwa]
MMMAYIGHRNGAQELELAPEPLSGEEIFVQINVMHIEKNVCANLIGILLDIPGKTKDEVKSRLDLVELNIRPELAPQVGEKKILDMLYIISSREVQFLQHMESLCKLNSGKARSKKWIQEEHNRSFSRWLSTQVALALEVPKNFITPSLRWIAHGPSPDVATYSGYIINGYYYHTKRRDDIRRIQNSGVSITATTMQVSSSKDKSLVMSDIMFYGVIQEIWEIDYHQLSFTLFKFDWVDNRSGVKVDKLGFTIMDLKRIGHKSDSFILATQAKKVFYVQDSANPEWSVVLTSPQRTIEEDFFKDEIGDMLQKCGYETIKRMPNVDTPNETDDTNSTYIRHDCEGRWVEKDS